MLPGCAPSPSLVHVSSTLRWSHYFRIFISREWWWVGMWYKAVTITIIFFLLHHFEADDLVRFRTVMSRRMYSFYVSLYMYLHEHMMNFHNKTFVQMQSSYCVTSSKTRRGQVFEPYATPPPPPPIRSHPLNFRSWDICQDLSCPNG